jgi:hypothetical protein
MRAFVAYLSFMHRHFIFAFFASVLGLSCAAPAAAQQAKPSSGASLPNATELLQRALANERKLAAEQERYECRVSEEITQTDSKGKVKKTVSEVSDQFYVNGIAIERTLKKNGKDLSPGEVRKQDERVMKETLKYSNASQAKKEEDKQAQELEDLMEAMMLANGRRERVDGRSVLFYDIVPNPKFQARNLNQRLARVMQGKISIDEQSGEIIDINVKSTGDLKIGGGMLANIHKGFWLHVHDHPQPDGVWLTDLVEGSGDARAALFLHPYFRFRQTTDNCRLYTATATQTGSAQPLKK